MFLWLLELKVDHGREWTKQKMFEDVKTLRHLICQRQQWWLRIAHKMQEPRSPREIAAVNIRTLPSPGSRDQPARWACKCSTLMSPKTKDQMASPTFYPTSRSPKIFLFLQWKQGVPKKSCQQNAAGARKFQPKKMQMLGTYEPQDQRPGGQPNILPTSQNLLLLRCIARNWLQPRWPKIRRLLSRRPTAPLDFCPKSRLHALALGHLTSSEKTIRRHHNQLMHHPHFTTIHPDLEKCSAMYPSSLTNWTILLTLCENFLNENLNWLASLDISWKKIYIQISWLILCALAEVTS